MFHLKQFERNRSSDIRRRSTDVCFELARFSHPFVTLVIEEFQGIGGNGKGYFFLFARTKGYLLETFQFFYRTKHES